MSSILHIFVNWDVLALSAVVPVSGAIRTIRCQYWTVVDNMNGRPGVLSTVACEYTNILLNSDEITLVLWLRFGMCRLHLFISADMYSVYYNRVQCVCDCWIVVSCLVKNRIVVLAERKLKGGNVTAVA